MLMNNFLKIKSAMMGISYNSPDNHYNTIDYALYTRIDHTIGLFESGTNITNFPSYSVGDVFRIERTMNDEIVYYINGSSVRTVTDPNPNQSMIIDFAFYQSGSILEEIEIKKTVATYEPVITMKADYYAGGMIMPGRSNNLSESRHLFNGMEADNEVSGDGNSYTTQFRQYDPRLGRWKSRDPLQASFPWQSPYVAFDNNPIYFTDPLGLAAGKGDGDPPKGGEPEVTQDYSHLDIEITAKAPSSESKDQAIVDRALGQGNFASGGKFGGDYGSDDWDSFMNRTFGGSQGFQNLQRLQSKMSSTQKVNIYNSYSRSGDGLNVQEESDGEWRRKADEVIMEGKAESFVYFTYFAGGLAAAGGGVILLQFAPVVLANPWAVGILKTGVLKGTINAGINLTIQSSIRDDSGDIDWASAGISFGSGFLPGSTTKELIRNAAVSGLADANVDYSANDGWSQTFEKSTTQRINETIWGAINVGGGNVFKNVPVPFQAWGKGVVGTGTQGISYGINDQIKKK